MSGGGIPGFPPGPSPRFATDPTYTAPTLAWDGTATKVMVPLAERQRGFAPSEAPPAQYFNWLLNRLGEYTNQLNSLQVSNWQASTVTSTNQTTHVIYDVGNGLWLRGSHWSSGSKGAQWSVDRRIWNDWAIGSIDSNVKQINDIASDGAGKLVAVSADGNISTGVRYPYYSTDGKNWTQGSFGGDGLIISHHLVFAHGLFIVAGYHASSILARVFTSPDGVTWTERTLPNQALAGAIGLDFFIATAGSVTVLATPGGVTWYSTNGTTWLLGTPVLPGPALDTFGNCTGLCWSPTDGQLCWADDAGNKLWSSTDGIIWIARGGIPVTPPGELAAAGNCILVASTGSQGLFSYSFDGGDTWSSRPDIGETIVAVSSVRGQFFISTTSQFMTGFDLGS